MPDTKLELKGLQELLFPLVQGKKLANKSLKVELASTSVQQPLPIGLDDVTFTISGDADVALFNAKDDKDPDKLMGPLIEYSGERAWLKYRTGVSAKAALSMEASGFNFSFTGVAHPQLGSYRVHAPDDSAWTAIKSDLESPRFILSAASVKKLRDHEAVFLRVPGTLALGVGARWSHIFSNGLSALANLLDVGQALAVNIEASLTASFKVSVEDDFLVALARRGDDFRLMVRKSEKKVREGKFEPRIGVEFVDPKDARKVLETVLGALLEKPPGEVRDAIQGKSDDDLARDEETRGLVDRLLARLGIDAVANKSEVLGKALDKLEGKVQGLLDTVAKASVKFAFTYDYSRVSSKSMMLDASFPEVVLDEHHKQLLRGKLQGFLADAAKQPSQIQVAKYVREDKLVISHAYGFGLSLGKWQAFFGKDVSTQERVITSDYDIGNGRVREKVALTEQRGYKAKWFGQEWSWMMTLQGTMDGLSAADTATADEFKYGASVLMQQELGKVSDDERAQMLDVALIWGVLPLDGIGAHDQRLKKRLDRAKDVTMTCELKLGDDALRVVVARLASLGKEGIAQALGKAMPWTKAHASVRQHPGRREEVYAPLWLWYLKDRNAKARDLAAKAAQVLANIDSDLAYAEGRDWTDVASPTIAGMAYAAGSIRGTWDDLGRAAGDFMRAYSGARPYQQASAAMHKMRYPGEQIFWLRAFGAYALDALEDHPGLWRDTKRILTLEFTDKDSGKKAVETLTSSKNPAG